MWHEMEEIIDVSRELYLRRGELYADFSLSLSKLRLTD